MTTMKTLGVKEGPDHPRIGQRITVDVELEGLPITAIVDTGSPVSILSSMSYGKL